MDYSTDDIVDFTRKFRTKKAGTQFRLIKTGEEEDFLAGIVTDVRDHEKQNRAAKRKARLVNEFINYEADKKVIKDNVDRYVSEAREAGVKANLKDLKKIVKAPEAVLKALLRPETYHPRKNGLTKRLLDVVGIDTKPAVIKRQEGEQTSLTKLREENNLLNKRAEQLGEKVITLEDYNKSLEDNNESLAVNLAIAEARIKYLERKSQRQPEVDRAPVIMELSSYKVEEAEKLRSKNATLTAANQDLTVKNLRLEQDLQKAILEASRLSIELVDSIITTERYQQIALFHQGKGPLAEIANKMVPDVASPWYRGIEFIPQDQKP